MVTDDRRDRHYPYGRLTFRSFYLQVKQVINDDLSLPSLAFCPITEASILGVSGAALSDGS
jgi:hypothetical protein